MKQVSQNYKTGALRLEDVNSPALKPGGVLVRTAFSAISAGTEGMKVKEGRASYLGKARARPDQVKKVIKSVQQQGLMATYYKVMNKLDSLTPLGYSLSGVVTEVGRGAEEFQVGQRVACGGAGYANHAEINFIPKNLVVPVPGKVPMDQASFATIGAVAMQGFRQSSVRLGESACVIGLGLLGQILVQILRASGVRVVGIDLVRDRCQVAREQGALAAFQADDEQLAAKINQLTTGIGIDCTFITAGGASNGPVEVAIEIARDRGQIVDVGKTKLDLDWSACYLKELDVIFSRSYGPGRYDPNYEEGGIDYPVGYVRWTERRNMAAVIDLLSEGLMDMGAIISSTHPFAEAEQVYQDIAEGKSDGLGIVFQHSDDIANTRRLWSPGAGAEVERSVTGKVRIGAIGAGNYASSMLFPHLHKNPAVELSEVATATSLSGRDAASKFGIQAVRDRLQGDAG